LSGVIQRDHRAWHDTVSANLEASRTPSRHGTDRFFVALFERRPNTSEGAALLRNFTHDVAGCRSDWTMARYRAEAVGRIRRQVGYGQVVCGPSGGVDSAVAAVLLHEAIDDQLTCTFVDTGLLRLGEADEVVDLFRRHFNIPLVHRDAGELFLAVLDVEARKLGDVEFLAQGLSILTRSNRRVPRAAHR
jgi:GMP synthase (glutamine-hydrolysing)